MIRQAIVWGILLSKVGNLKRQGQQLESFFRYFVVSALAEEGLFDFLEEPRSYSQIIGRFGFADDSYTHLVLDTLVNDPMPLIIEEDGCFRRNSDVPLPDLHQIAAQAAKHMQKFSMMAQGMVKYLLPRLRNEKVEFAESFQQDGRQLLTKFDMTLGGDVYTRLRNASFAFLTGADRERMHGAKLLEVGCGSGRETAELWLRHGGNIHITAIDLVESLLNLARERFRHYLDDMEPGHPPLGLTNRPTFYQVDVLKLPFDDHTFDAVFHAFVLHWTPDPAQAVREIARVLKPGGLVFGVQPLKPAAGKYFDILVRTSDSHGFFKKEDLREWYARAGIDLEIATPLGMFRGLKPSPLPEVAGQAVEKSPLSVAIPDSSVWE